MAGKPKLTPKQAAFVAEYQKDMNATRAAIAAGYAESSAHVTGSKMLRHPKVAAELTKVTSKAVERAQVSIATDEAVATAAWVTAQAVEIVQRSLEAKPVYEGRGEKRRLVEGVWTYDGGNAVAALNLLAKRHPEFSDKHDVNVDLTARIEALAAITTMSPEQLRELAGGARG